MLAPTARIGFDIGSNVVFATASDSDHAILKEATRQLDGQVLNAVVKVYPLDRQQIAAQTLLDSLDPALADELSIQTNQQLNSLIVRGSEEHHHQLKATIDEILQGLANADPVATEVYHFKNTTSLAALTVLKSLMPDAVFAAEPRGKVLAATATPEAHKRISAIVKQIDEGAPAADQSTRVYRFAQGKAQYLSKAFSMMAPDARVGYDPGSNVVFVTATEKEHEMLQAASNEINGQVKGSVVKVYSLDRDKLAAATLIDSLDETLKGKLSIQTNDSTNSLIVRGTDEDHKQLQQTIDAIMNGMSGATKVITQVYQFENATALPAIEVLQTLMPDAVFAADRKATVFAATATPKAHERIAEIVKQIDMGNPNANRKTEIYRFEKGSAKYLYKAFQMMAPKANVGFDPGSNVVFVTASAEDHKMLKEAAAKMNGQAKGSIVKVYALDREKLTAQMFVDSLDKTLLAEVNIQANDTTNSLIVRADKEIQDQIQQAIDEIMTALPNLPKPTTTVYPLKLANATVVAESLGSLAPEATIAADPDSNTLLVTANEVDHQRIVDVVNKLDVASGSELTVQVYPVKNAEGRRIYDSVSRAFERSRDYSITYQDATSSLYVIATPRNQAVFKEMFQALDQSPAEQKNREQKIYLLENIDAGTAQATIRSIMKGQNPGPDMHHNNSNNSLVIFASPQQHQQIQTAIDQLDGDMRELEVFELVANDPYVVEQAINGIFRSLPGSLKPSLSNDFATGKLFVRATPAHLTKIRELLAKLGEPVAGTEQSGEKGNTRSIRFAGDTASIAKQIENVWPRIRANRIQVILPAKSRAIETAPEKPDEQIPPARKQPKPDDEVRQQKSTATTLVMQNQSTRAPVPQTKPTTPQSKEKSEPLKDAQLPPVFILPGDNQITISSEDTAALDRLESLLRAMSANMGSRTSQSNFAVFLLRNMGASETKLLLDQLFEDINQRGLNDVVFVADERLNALVVHGTRHARDVIQELLETLESADLPDPLDVYRPEMITLEHAQADRVSEILKNVYKNQLTSGGGRAPIEIPKGVQASVASILQQINAASAGPVLTLDIDDTTNSLIVRAPPELRREISEFVGKLDSQAGENRNRQVKVIRLERTKSDRMHEVLQQFLARPGNTIRPKKSKAK